MFNPDTNLRILLANVLQEIFHNVLFIIKVEIFRYCRGKAKEAAINTKWY